jgi:hypothetical protein
MDTGKRWRCSSPAGLEPVQDMDPERGRKIAIGWPSIIDLGNELRKRDPADIGDRPQLLPEWFLQRKAGAMAMQRRRMLADHNMPQKMNHLCLKMIPEVGLIYRF